MLSWDIFVFKRWRFLQMWCWGLWKWKLLRRVWLFATLDYTVHGILQARILERVAFPFSRDLPNPGIEPRSPALLADSLPAEPQGKPTGNCKENPPAMQEPWVQSLGWEDPLEEGEATHFSILSWRIPWTVTRGSQRVRHNWATFTFSRGSFQQRDQSQVSRIAGRFFTVWASIYISIILCLNMHFYVCLIL